MLLELYAYSFMLMVSSPWVQPRPIQKARESQLRSSPVNSALNYKLQICSNIANQNIYLLIYIKFSKSLINFLDTMKKHSTVGEWEKWRGMEETFLLSERKTSRNNGLLGHQVMTQIFASKSLEDNSSSETLVLVLVLHYFHSLLLQLIGYLFSIHRNCYFSCKSCLFAVFCSHLHTCKAILHSGNTHFTHNMPDSLFLHDAVWMSGSR